MSVKAPRARLRDCLEAVHCLTEENRIARVSDISRRLEISFSSVGGAIKELAEKRLVRYTAYQPVTLTLHGESLARESPSRQEIIRDFLIKTLVVGERDAATVACNLKYVVSSNLLDRLVEFVHYVENCSGEAAGWIRVFKHHSCNTDASKRGEELVEC
jgi:DtxR family Mn-dependent transcriptional regulator